MILVANQTRGKQRTTKNFLSGNALLFPALLVGLDEG